MRGVGHADAVAAIAIIVAGGAGLVTGVVGAWLSGRRGSAEQVDVAHAEASALVESAKLEANAARRGAENQAREQALEARTRADEVFTAQRDALDKSYEELADGLGDLESARATLEQAHAELDERKALVKSLRDRAAGLVRDAAELRDMWLVELEKKAGTSGEQVVEALAQQWLETANAEAAHVVRTVEQHGGADPDVDRSARRVMGIAASRYENHFLTERSISRLPLAPNIAELMLEQDGRVHRAVETVSNVKLLISDDQDAIKLEGLDGVGREIARRALKRLARKSSAIAACRADPEPWVETIRTQLHREIITLGRKAFTVLKLPRAHEEIVDLVGRLNYRTSYTQNQWRHAMEAAFLASMIAEELGLDVKLARRAALLHDIGKSLTHEIEGSHAVIGADIARRLGEDEIVANAIGSHHADEPANSAYAYLIAATDAMSGARPGARREFTDSFGNRVEDLERLGVRYRGVQRAYAVHGGRELRVYVSDKDYSDLDVVDLSGKIAAEISEELTFPGQIKVTVIRSYEAIATAS